MEGEGKCASAPNVYSAFSPVQIFTTAPLKIGKNISGDYVALNVYPNPFMNEAIIQFILSENSLVNLELLDLSGRKIKTILECNFEPGNHQLNFSAEDLSKGIYLVRFNANYHTTFLKIVKQ